MRTRPNATAAELDFREPEGLAISYPRHGTARLHLGFASGVVGDRRSNIYYLERC